VPDLWLLGYLGAEVAMKAPTLTVLQERALLQISDMSSVRIAEQTCIRTAEYDPNEVTLGRAVADALLRAGAVEYVSYRRVKITEVGLSVVRRVTGVET